MSGVEFHEVNGVTRSVYKQFDGSVKLADECICWDGIKKLNCPIDEHAAAAREPVEDPVNRAENSETLK